MPHLLPTPWLIPTSRLLPSLVAGCVVLAALPIPVNAAGQGERNRSCRAALQAGDQATLRGLQQQLQASLPVPPQLEAVLATAEALLACAAPEAALQVLARISAAPGEERQRWLVMQWRAAQAGLYHGLAAQALQALADDEPASLETLLLPLDAVPAEGSTGRAVSSRRPAIDLLADHLESLGETRLAAAILLSSRQPGPLTAARWGRAFELLPDLPPAERDALMERALELAAASETWGLVAALLDLQLVAAGDSAADARALERRLRLGARIDDVYGEWLQRRRQAAAVSGADGRVLQLEEQLRSPRGPGGHAAPDSVPLSTSSPALP
ncbi:MAG: hypothetical protein VKM34_12415 [Cyanobacteriota bacterium]|nr:hypothetical protein [Cyanobacteriota bacterium]